ncbi:MAG: hypothetical protein EAY75_08100 [Bacteroidetes bacterium]|nr:MAG: hypothetical protein EAY75_08100 [Bacteroidota bacterium]
MMNYKFRLLPIAAMALLLLAGCDKKFSVPQQTSAMGSTYMKVYVAATGITRNYVFVNDRQVSGALLASGGVFPLASASPGILFQHNNLFSVQQNEIRPIAQRITIRDTTLTTLQPPTTLVTNLETLSNYTLFLTDSSLRPNIILVKDNIQPVGDTTARIRFANLPFSPLAIPNMDIFSVRANSNIFNNVPINTVTGFMAYASARNDTLHVRAAGTTVNLASINGIVATQKRYYTVVLRGSYRNPGSRVLASFANY